MSVQQIEALIDFLEGHKELALGRCTRSKEGRSLAKRLWQECAGLLNSVSSDCAQKTGEQWRLFYNEYKHRLLKKIKKEKSERSATGGGSRIEINLTPLQERLYTILGRDVGEPLPGVRHNPFSPIENEGGSATATTSYHDGENVVTYEVSQFDDILHSSGIVEMEVVEPEQPEHSEPIGSWAFLEPAVQSTLASRETLQNTEGQQTEPAGSQAAQAQLPQQPAPQRRRRRRQQVTETEGLSLQSATETLQTLERISAEATNRLAAAIEALGARLNEPIRVILEDPHPSVHRRRNRILSESSDSE